LTALAAQEVSMEVGLSIPHVGPSANREALIPFVQLVEACGFDSLWVADHVVVAREQRSRYPYSPDGKLPFPPMMDFLEPVAALTFVAAVTNRVKLGTSVLVLPMRQPVQHAKWLATIDHLSNGRLILGVGSGWWKEEFETLGVPFERRGKRLDEGIELLRKMWTGEFVDHHGEFYEVDGWASRPVPAQASIPIWVGGENDLSVRRAGALGDGWMATPQPVEQLKARWEMAREAAQRAGKDPSKLTLSIVGGGTLRQDNLEEVADGIRRWSDAGVTHIVAQVHPRLIPEAEPVLRSFGEKYLPALQAL
jgi:probable F420-dependent oxidoreductase